MCDVLCIVHLQRRYCFGVLVSTILILECYHDFVMMVFGALNNIRIHFVVFYTFVCLFVMISYCWSTCMQNFIRLQTHNVLK